MSMPRFGTSNRAKKKFAHNAFVRMGVNMAMAFVLTYSGPDGFTNAPQPQRSREYSLEEQRDRLRDLKILMTDRFGQYRLGVQQFNTYDEAEREAYRLFINIPPRRGRWPGHPRQRDAPRQTIYQMLKPAPRQKARARAKGALVGLLRWRPGRGGRGNQQGNNNARRARKAAEGMVGRLRREFRPARFRFRRILGFGGFGAAFLFEMRDGEGLGVPVVVKGLIGGRGEQVRAMEREKENFVAMAGAQHFVQRCVLQTFPLPKSGPLDTLRGLFSKLRVKANAPQQNNDDDDDGYYADDDDASTLVGVPTSNGSVQAARRALDRRRDIIIMEYMSRGTLQDLLNKIPEGERLSDRMLWFIFECLFKACVAMAYPSRFCPADRDPWNDLIVPEDETVPRPDVFPDAPMVHFDIDPQNALVGDFGPPGGDHSSVPIVKIGDPGLGEMVDWNFSRDEFNLWAQRICGKPDFFTPEQFTPEWDYEASRSLDHLAREQTAGNYQWWSNLYQVGCVMWCLITQCFPPDPPVALPYWYPAEDGRDVVCDGHSYGALLESEGFDAADSRLRRLVVRCMDHNPWNRPRMGFLEEVFDVNVGRMDLRGMESDEELMMNARRIFGEPP
ncbi:hypothetical protein VMCG_10932 [Cytospora schulzeri]|uniref:Protein kinase domain-containing protein n=1 Tax=Cytospora schulzeri TaxID=448051 RepID=A0A423V7I0_9PEZI|nr:hypothetical protein VMCG_10932 [Valsa malicola]